MKEIYNTTTKEANLIENNAKAPKGWTDKNPRWQLHEFWDGLNWAVPENVEEIIAKDKAIQEAKQELVKTDMEMARIFEEVIDALDSKNVLNKSELPTKSLTKITNRKALRISLQKLLGKLL